MGVTLDAQNRALLGSFAQTVSSASQVGIAVGSLDRFSGLRVLAASSGAGTNPYSFSVALYQGHSSNIWLGLERYEVSTCAMLEFDCLGRYGLIVVTVPASAAYVAGAAYALPISGR